MDSTLLTLLFVCLSASVTSHREHKVHNLVLYPDKHSWCTVQEIKQVIGHPGCEQIELENNVCVGTCFSYSIPRTEPTAPGQMAPYCDSCQPSQATWKHVTLKCDSNEVEGGSLSKKVEIIENCTCSSYTSQQTEADSQEPEPPHIVSLSHNHSKEHHHHSHEHDSRLAMSLKDLNEAEEVAVDHESLKTIMSQMKAEGNPDIDDNALEEIANKAEELANKKNSVALESLLSKLYPESNQHHQSTHRHHHHAHGPHHPLPEVLGPTLNMDSHHLKPAVEGEEITYHAYPHHKSSED